MFCRQFDYQMKTSNVLDVSGLLLFWKIRTLLRESIQPTLSFSGTHKLKWGAVWQPPPYLSLECRKGENRPSLPVRWKGQLGDPEGVWTLITHRWFPCGINKKVMCHHHKGMKEERAKIETVCGVKSSWTEVKVWALIKYYTPLCIWGEKNKSGLTVKSKVSLDCPLWNAEGQREIQREKGDRDIIMKIKQMEWMPMSYSPWNSVTSYFTFTLVMWYIVCDLMS